MNRILRTLLTGVLAFCMAACFTGSPQDSKSASTSSSFIEDTRPAVSDSEFTTFLDKVLVETMEQSYLLTHYRFLHPKKYGIDISKCDVTLGDVLTSEEEKKQDEDLLEQLNAWSPRNLSKGNRQLYDQLVWTLTLSTESSRDEYDYVMQIWGPNDSPASTLVTTFSEYILYSEEDIAPLIELINDCPRYVTDCMDYSREQARLGLFAIDFDAAMKDIDNTLENRDDSVITRSLDEQVDVLGLEAAKADEWKEKIHQALDEAFFPSFETMKEDLEALKDKNKPVTGLASRDHGKEAYEILLKSYSGTSKTPDELRYEVTEYAKELASAYLKMSQDNEELTESPQTPFTEISEIMPFLAERYAAAFPIVDELDYEIKPLTNEQSQESVLAYFVTTPFDYNGPYRIRYNRRDYADDPSSLQLYDTFAHEGIPGHMYQQQYQKEHFTHPIRYVISSLAMQEGYAVYAAYQTLPWTGIDEVDLDYYRVSDLYSNCIILLMDLTINYDGMSREEFVKTYGEENGPLYDQLALSPGIFFSYYFGNLQLLELQDIAKEALGDLYDPVDFNEALLSPGNLNFEIITQSVQDYIDTVRRGSGQSEQSSTKDSSASSEKPLPPTVSNKDKDRKKKDSAKPVSQTPAPSKEESMQPFEE